MHSFMRSSRVEKSDDDVPSWLTDMQEEDKQSSGLNTSLEENTPLITKSTSYGGSSGEMVEVDYGDTAPVHPAHVSYGINQETGPDISWANDDPYDGTNTDGALFEEKNNISASSDDRFDDEMDDLESNSHNKQGKSKSSPRKEKNDTSWAVEESEKETKQKFGTKKKSAKLLPAAKKPKRYPFHLFFILIQCSGIFANVAMILTQIIPLIICADLAPLQYVLRSYIIFFSFCFFLGELEVSMFLRSFTSMSNWISRGFLYTFIGTITMEQHDALIVDDSFRASNSRVENMFLKDYWSPGLALLFMQISAWWITCLGILYFLMGVACMQNKRERLREDYENRWEIYKEQILYGGVEGDLDVANKKIRHLKRKKAKK